MSSRANVCSASLEAITEDVSALIDAAALDPAAWRSVITELAHRLPGTKAVFQVVDRVSGVCVPMTLAGWDPAVAQSYTNHYGTMNPWSPIMISAAEQTVLFSEDRLPASAFRNTEFYVDWLSRGGGIDASTGIKLIDAEGRLGVIAVHYDLRDAERTNSQAASLLTMLAPRLRRAIDVNKACFTQERPFKEGDGLLEAISDPVLVITADHRLLGANSQAWRLIEEGGLIRIGAKDRIVFDNVEFANDFSWHVAQAVTSSAIEQFAKPRLKSVSAHQKRYNIFATLLNRNSASAAGMELLLATKPTVIVVLKHYTASATTVAGLFRKLGLTPAEIRLALKMDGSRPLAAIAADLGIGYETARTHRRSAYAKLGITRHAQFIALMLQFSSML